MIYCSSLLSLVMARRPDVVQRPSGSNSLPSSSIQGLILHILHKTAKHLPLGIPPWQGELNSMHQIFWSMLIYDQLALNCNRRCFDTAIRSRETARGKANFKNWLKNAKSLRTLGYINRPIPLPGFVKRATRARNS